MTTPRKSASMIFINSSAKVLLYLRDDSDDIPFASCWDLLGGHVERGESAEEAIAREIDEEIEYEIEVPPQLFRMSHMEDRDEYTFWELTDLDIDRTPLHEGQRLQWFSEPDVRGMDETKVAFGFKRILLDFFDEVRRRDSSMPETR